MQRLYDDNLYRFDAPQPSYWEATAGTSNAGAVQFEGDESCDVAIIGGGYTGLSAALHLARDYQIEARVLEAGHVGWGASGRNGGFCTVGGTGVQRHQLINLCGLDDTRHYYRSQVEAVNLVRSTIAEEEIDCQQHGEAEFQVAHTAKAYATLESDFELLSNALAMDVELVSAGEFGERFYNSTEQFGALVSRPSFGLHPLRYCRGLAAAAMRRGTSLHPHSEVIDWRKSNNGTHRLSTHGGTLRARKVVFATNGFIPEQLRPEFHGRTLPVISAVIVTRPLRADELAAQNWQSPHPTINARRVLNYFRLLPDNRFLFGGRGDTRGDADAEHRTYEGLIETLRQFWPNWRDVEIDYRWQGLICMTKSLRPSIGQLDEDPGIYFGFGYHGNGVNTATWAGKQLADWIGQGRAPRELPAIVRGLSRKFPLPRLRPSYLRMALRTARWFDNRR